MSLYFLSKISPLDSMSFNSFGIRLVIRFERFVPKMLFFKSATSVEACWVISLTFFASSGLFKNFDLLRSAILNIPLTFFSFSKFSLSKSFCSGLLNFSCSNWNLSLANWFEILRWSSWAWNALSIFACCLFWFSCCNNCCSLNWASCCLWCIIFKAACCICALSFCICWGAWAPTCWKLLESPWAISLPKFIYFSY